MSASVGLLSLLTGDGARRWHTDAGGITSVSIGNVGLHIQTGGGQCEDIGS